VISGHPNPDSNTVPYIQWLGSSEYDATDLLIANKERQKRRRPRKIDICAERLEELRGKGPQPVSDVYDRAVAHAETWRQALQLVRGATLLPRERAADGKMGPQFLEVA
jgi:hypothetical protein